MYFCALSLSDKQAWFESLKAIIDIPKLPKNDGTKFSVATKHKFSANSSGEFPDVVAAIALEKLDALLLGTKDALSAIYQSKVVELAKSACVRLIEYEDVIFAIQGRVRNR